jgi:hypothetical protein
MLLPKSFVVMYDFYYVDCFSYHLLAVLIAFFQAAAFAMAMVGMA